MKKEVKTLNIGLSEKERKSVVDILNVLLASSYALYIKTQNFHWNVTGPHFISYHGMFQSQYEELAETIDEIAERIRALGFFSEGSFSAFAKESLIKDEKGVPPPKKMIETLLQDHETIICFLRKKLPIAEKMEDGASADFINKRLASHEKTAWMLRSTI